MRDSFVLVAGCLVDLGYNADFEKSSAQDGAGGCDLFLALGLESVCPKRTQVADQDRLELFRRDPTPSKLSSGNLEINGFAQAGRLGMIEIDLAFGPCQ